MNVANDVVLDENGFRFATLVSPGSSASLVLGQAGTGDDTPFDQHRVGLHHVAYHVPERADLDEWTAHLDALHIPHSGIRTNGPEAAGAQVLLQDPDASGSRSSG